MKDAYEKLKDLFGEDLTNSMFPELGIQEALFGIIAMLQTICDILILKGIITKEEYLKMFSVEELKKVAKRIEKQAVSESKGE